MAIITTIDQKTRFIFYKIYSKYLRGILCGIQRLTSFLISKKGIFFFMIIYQN